jgi:hypothetical protein
MRLFGWTPRILVMRHILADRYPPEFSGPDQNATTAQYSPNEPTKRAFLRFSAIRRMERSTAFLSISYHRHRGSASGHHHAIRSSRSPPQAWTSGLSGELGTPIGIAITHDWAPKLSNGAPLLRAAVADINRIQACCYALERLAHNGRGPAVASSCIRSFGPSTSGVLFPNEC